MAHKAKDGTPYTNKMMANRHNARMDSQDQSAPPSDPAQEQSGQEDGSSSPDADQHVDALLASGMTPDDIHAHAKKRAGQEQQQEPEPKHSASLSSIPGM